jgi:hypothetical protein
MLMWHLTQNGCVMSILITMWIYFYKLATHLHPKVNWQEQMHPHEKQFKGHLNFLERTKEIGFFQCHHFVLNEIDPFLHNPYCRHDWHVNCIFLLSVFDIKNLVIMMKPNFVRFNCCTSNKTPMVNITTRMNATICSFWSNFGLTLVVGVLL